MYNYKACYCKCSQCNGGRLWYPIYIFSLWPKNYRSKFIMTYNDSIIWIRLPLFFRYIINHSIMEASSWD